MSRSLNIALTDQERYFLEKVLRSRTAQARKVLRARIVLLAAEGLPNGEIARRLACNISTARVWRNRFHALGVKGLTEQKGRGRKPFYDVDRQAQIVAATLRRPNHATHWSARRLGRSLGVPKSTVHRVWQTYDLHPDREKTFKYSGDPMLTEKVVDVIGLYLNPPEEALVLGVDEKSQIQALDRTQPLLPLGPGRPAARTHDYRRCGTTTLYAALNLTQPEVVGRCTKRHRHQELLAFMRDIDLHYPQGQIHLILDNYATHKHPKVERWFARRPRYHRHFTPTSASWMNLVEVWFSILTRQRIRRGTFSSVQKLTEAIHNYIGNWNEHPVPFKWTKTPDQVLRHYSIDNSGTDH